MNVKMSIYLNKIFSQIYRSTEVFKTANGFFVICEKTFGRGCSTVYIVYIVLKYCTAVVFILELLFRQSVRTEGSVLWTEGFVLWTCLQKIVVYP